MATVQKVFISSTCDDLAEFREAARDAALKTGFFPVLSEYFPASGSRAPLEKCLVEVEKCDICIVIVAHRYGWVPEAQTDSSAKSITWLEFEQAVEKGKEILAFLVDESAHWPEKDYEQYQAALEIQKPTWDPARMDAIKRNVANLSNFKELLRSRGIRASFGSPEELRGEVIAALNHWQLQNDKLDHPKAEHPLVSENPTRALRMLLHQTEFIDIRGLQVGSGKAHRIPIDELYIPLKAQDTGLSVESEKQGNRAVALHETLTKRKLMLIGDPGSGKTTFLRRIAHAVCETLLGNDPNAANSKLGIQDEPPYPIYVRLFHLSEFIEYKGIAQSAPYPTLKSSPDWLIRYLVCNSEEFSWGLSESFFREKLLAGTALLLFDGLDEAPNHESRKVLTELIENVAEAYDACRFVVTCRPKAYVGEVVMTSFDSVRVAPLDDAAIDIFVRLWCERLYPDAPELSESHRRELKGALKVRLEIRRMATNPVMLTALAVVHWNEKRIPEQRAELYESIITWLSRARQNRSGRPGAERCVALLQKLAFALQNHPDGRQVQARRHWSATLLADDFTDSNTFLNGQSRAERFLEDEELDSGIIVGRGDDIRFWHLSFQEFLAARALAGISESLQKNLVLDQVDKLLSSEWRETILLFAGILYRQGANKVDAMISGIIKNHAVDVNLARKAQIVGLIGEMLRDLEPMDYRYVKPDYLAILEEVMAIFKTDITLEVPFDVRLEAANALGQAGDPRIDEHAWITFPAGSFLMGGQSAEPNSEGFDAYALLTEAPPQHIQLNSFCIARFPVTVQEFRKFIDAGGYHEPRFWQEGGFQKWDEPAKWESQVRFPNHPITGVSWFEAVAYCQWLGDDMALPTEAQWERAARGLYDRRFPWGQSPPNRLRCNFRSIALDGTTPIGFFQGGETPEGISDMSGNVFEWCSDTWRDYTQSETIRHDNQTADDLSSRIVRGGSYRSTRNFLRAAFRGRYPANFQGNDVGFRLCRNKLP